jgi:hypothetical protein
MRKVSAWFTLGSFVLFGSMLGVGCGSDEATKDDDDGNSGWTGGGVLDGGNKEGGAVRDSGSSSGTSRVGRACTTNAECGSDDDLFCVNDTDVETFGAAPAGGICTKECFDDSECPGGSVCSLGFCFEACEPGANSSTLNKCHGREEVVCTLLPRESAGCDLDGDCPVDGEVCIANQCWMFGCQPNCGSDADCADDMFCDFDFGFCVTKKPEGKNITDACDPGRAVDECQGFCIANDESGETGFCTALCNLGSPVGCGFDGKGKADAACLFATALVPDPGPNDIGLCGQLCDCNSDCSVKGDLCAEIGVPQLEDFWQRKGYCRPPGNGFDEDDSLSKCPDTGGGGEGGAPGMGTGEGGAPSEPDPEPSEGGAGGAGG